MAKKSYEYVFCQCSWRGKSGGSGKCVCKTPKGKVILRTDNLIIGVRK